MNRRRSIFTPLFQAPFRATNHRTSLYETPHNPSTCSLTRASLTPPKSSKKPYGYWKHLPNVLSELEIYMSTINPRPTTMPTAHELSLAGRHDLAGAIRRHTWRKIAKAANLPLSSHARPRSLNLSFCTHLRTERIHPYMYWRDWQNLEKEIRQFIHLRESTDNPHKRGSSVMPTAGELVQYGRSDLKRAISLHGGVRVVANRLGLVPKSHQVLYWNRERVFEEIGKVMQRTGKHDAFPTIEDMRRFGERGLPSAVRRLGGARALAKLMRLSVRRKSQKDFLSHRQ